jgi:hypothetical protein
MISVVHYDDSESPNPPREFQPKGVPQGTDLVLSHLERGLSDTSNQHETMRGGAPGQLRSQPAVQEVRESDLMPLQPFIGWRLAMAKSFYNEQRTAMVMSDVNSWKSFDFHAANLSKSTRLYIPTEPNMPISIDGKLNALAKMQAMGLDPRIITTMFSELFHVDRMEGIASIGRNHKEAQRRELQLHLLNGSPLGVNVWDEDDIHKQTIDEFRVQMGERFLELPDIVKAVVQDHWDAHDVSGLNKLGVEMQKQQMLAMATQPQVPPGQEQPPGQGQEQPQPQAVGVE